MSVLVRDTDMIIFFCVVLLYVKFISLYVYMYVRLKLESDC